MKGILEYDDRRAFEEKNKDLVDFWLSEKYNDEQNIGDLRYLILKAHGELSTLSRSDFGQYYLDSGKKRVKKLKISPLNEFNINRYHGRELLDIKNIASRFLEDFNSRGTREISLAEAENLAFIMVFDKTYHFYEKIKDQLNKFSKEERAFVSTADMIDLGVDIVAFDNDDNITKAYYVDTDLFDKDHLNHQIFKELYGIKPIKIDIREDV